MRQEKARQDAGLVSAAEARRKFDVPVFVTSARSGLDQPNDPRATLEAAQDSARAKGWIDRSGRLNDQWYEIVSALAYGQSFAYLYLTEPDKPETRAMVTVNHLAFRFVLSRDRVWIDELAPNAAGQALVACLPEVIPAAGQGVTVPTKILAAAGTEAENHQADQGDWIAYELGQAGIRAGDAKAVGRLANMADRMIGQFNVGIREPDGHSYLWPWAITTHHSPTGRVARITQLPRGENTLVTPADTKVLIDALRSYRDDLRRKVRDQQR
ncbi:ESX secretion-associated protein EspG [Saccharopolyspora hattusasensis]|uniref:ESX secretion-associated protein EspG n=1 Tax=Saccharopolyspora hattusasensis TaxID=1128679 RepID=UPI003D986816